MSDEDGADVARGAIQRLNDQMESRQVTTRSVRADAIAGELNAALRDGPRFVTQAEHATTKKQLFELIRGAARPHRDRGWTVRDGRMVLHTATGHWGHVRFVANGAQSPQLVSLFAGSLSPYLLRVWNVADPANPRRFEASHATVVWRNEAFRYDADSAAEPQPFDLRERYWAERQIVVGRRAASRWLADLVDRLVPIVESLCDDRAMRDWLTANDPDNPNSLRMAVLLTRSVGWHEELPRMLGLAEAAHDRHAATMASREPPIRVENNRSLFPGDWSNRKFAEYVASL